MQLRKELQVRSQAEKAALEARDAEMLFLARMSHEIRTPLNGILGLAELLVETLLDSEQLVLVQSMKVAAAPAPAPTSQAPPVPVQCSSAAPSPTPPCTPLPAQVASSHLLSIVNDILDLAKVTAGKLQLKEQIVKVTELPNECLNLFASGMKAKNITSNVHVAMDVPAEVIGDKTRLVQVFSNLISNAVKFTPPEGKINIDVFLATISDLRNESLKVTFRVSDTGKGMTLQETEQLFDAYYQCTSNIDRDHGGTGLGLSIVDKLVSLMGGKITVDSRVGRGTKFTLSIPFKNTEYYQGAALPKNESGTSSSDVLPIFLWQDRTCIVTDDTPLNVFVLQQKLTKKGVRVLTSENGSLCVDQYQANQCDVDFILMDIWMPVMDGLEATRALRRLGCSVPIVGLTADYTNTIAVQAIEAGMTEVLLKPVSWVALEKVLSKALLPNHQASLNDMSLRECGSEDGEPRGEIEVVVGNTGKNGG